MSTANLLANLWGLFFVLIPLSFLINSGMLRTFLAEKEKEAALYCLGLVYVFIGAITIFFNNVWAMRWETILTVLGWIVLLKGVFFMFWTKEASAMMKAAEEKYLKYASYGLLVMLLVGLVLIYFGFLG